MSDALFELPPRPEPDPAEAAPAPRVQHPVRDQVEMRFSSLDQLLPADHRARIVWDFVMMLDLSPLYSQVRAVVGRAGRTPIDPPILLALWLYATIEGVGSARAIARLVEEHDAYRWICGGVSVNHHTLSDFRVDHAEILDGLLTQSVAALLAEGLVTLRRVAQDGVRVRASAGAASFRRKETLERCLDEAKEQVERLKKEIDEDPGAQSRREAAARRRAARERQERLQAALDQWNDVAKKKKVEEREEKARVSSTDPDARVMKMADGGFRPAVNGQFATDTETQVIVGVDVTNEGSDAGQMPPMVEQIEDRHERTSEDYLVDGGFATLRAIEEVTNREGGPRVYAPVQKPKDKDRDPYQPLPNDSPAVAEWRRRMGTQQAKEIYKLRASTAECVNAIARNRGLRQLLVRGLAKARAVLLMYALAHNMMRMVALRATATTAVA